MISKNLLLGAALLVGAATASAAFPTMPTILPPTYTPITSKSQMNDVKVSFSMKPADQFAVKEGATATIEYQASGEEITSTAITFNPAESTWACVAHIKFPDLTESAPFFVIILNTRSPTTMWISPVSATRRTCSSSFP